MSRFAAERSASRFQCRANFSPFGYRVCFEKSIALTASTAKKRHCGQRRLEQITPSYHESNFQGAQLCHNHLRPAKDVLWVRSYNRNCVAGPGYAARIIKPVGFLDPRVRFDSSLGSSAGPTTQLNCPKHVAFHHTHVVSAKCM